MAKVNAGEFAEKWGRRLKGSTEDIRRGIERVSTAPGELAAQKQEKMKAKLNEAIDNGTWASRVSGVSLGEWKEKAIGKGIGRISAGVDGSKSKMQEFASVLLPHVEAGQAKVSGMPDLTLDDSINRMGAFVRHMSTLKYKKR